MLDHFLGPIKSVTTQSKKWYVFVCFLYVICQMYVFCMFAEMAVSKNLFYVCFSYDDQCSSMIGSHSGIYRVIGFVAVTVQSSIINGEKN